ncbi:ATP:cob(I)alamin adenosyltransferase [Anopheles sinensis]|uniref:ATP:cob(I)alamin adenosyltransferase n=1 Tax=Anopheles sinensis TaxID=74873 RepID=A0A084VV60_ANOSI|nr:ATP:cob(I)alamin adenosyltransferase [Anopheles sinensis]
MQCFSTPTNIPRSDHLDFCAPSNQFGTTERHLAPVSLHQAPKGSSSHIQHNRQTTKRRSRWSTNVSHEAPDPSRRR